MGCTGSRSCGGGGADTQQFDFVKKYLKHTGTAKLSIHTLLKLSKDLPSRLNPAKYRILVNRLEIDLPFDAFWAADHGAT